MGLVISTPPTLEPVTVDELRAHLRIDDSAYDNELSRLITAARKSCEAYLNRQLIDASYQLTVDYWPAFPICLPIGPPDSVTSITYYDSSGVSQTWASSNYQVDSTGITGRIALASGATTPTLQTDRINAVTITFVAGYGATAASVPETVKQAILVLAGHWFENPAPTVVGQTVNPVPMHIQWMLNPELIAETY